MLVEKEVISPGTYWYVEEKTGIPRKWVVTAETTKQLHKDGNEMVALGLPIPVPYEHDFDMHPMTPKEKLLNNAGEVKEYRLKGDTLFSVVDVQDEAAKKKIGKSIRWTSPWVSSFTDGSGRQWNNVIAHLALTTRPRVMKQAPFPSVAAALSLATPLEWSITEKLFDDKNRRPVLEIKDAPKNGFCVSKAGRLVERKADKKWQPQFPMAFSLYSGGVALADDEEGMKPMKDDGEEDDSDYSNASDKSTDFGDQMGDVGMEELLCDLLGALGINVEKTGGEGAFKRALYNAAMTKIHELTNKGQGTGPDTNNQPPNGQGNNTPPNPLIQQEQQPMYMSLEEINKIADPTMKNIALSMYNENVKLRAEADADRKKLNALNDAKLKEEGARRATRVQMLGKLSPKVKADLDAMVALPGMALSMGEGGVVVDPMAQTLAVLEKGLADMPRLLTQDRAAFAEQPQPTDGEMLTAEQEDKLADEQARRMGCPPLPEKKAS